jgi:hypothetical protein
MEQPENYAGFIGWAIVELFGHQREIGYVSSRYFGTSCMFHIDVPGLPEREYTLKRPQYVDHTWTPEGAKVRKGATAGRTRFVGPGAIYALNPCSAEAAYAALEEMTEREVVLLELPKEMAKLPMPSNEPMCEECGRTPEEGHGVDCSAFLEQNEIER